MKTWPMIVAALLAAGDARAQRVGDTVEITRSYETSSKASDGSSGNSRGRTNLIERVIAVREDGIELQYDLPGDVAAQDRAREWAFPARVFRTADGAVRLLNGDALEARLARWLTAASIARTACGRWYFTWNAFRIECDTQSVLSTIAQYDLRSIDLREGAAFRDADALAPARLVRMPGAGTMALTATMTLDPEALRREQAQADMIVGEISRTPVTMDAALAARAAERVSGTIIATLDGDESGATRKVTVTRVTIARPDGSVENRVSTVTVERRRLTSDDGQRVPAPLTTTPL